MASSSPSLFLPWKFLEIGGRNAVMSRGRWQSRMHANLCSSRGHTEVIKKIRLAIVLHILHSVQTNCRIRLFPVSFWGWINIFAGGSVHKSTTLVCGSNFGFLQTSSLSRHSQPSKTFYFTCCNNFYFYSSESIFNVYWSSDWGIHFILCQVTALTTRPESCTNTHLYTPLLSSAAV